MGNDQKYYRVPTTLVVDTRSRETFLSFLDQPSPPTELQWIPPLGQTGTSPPSLTSMANTRLVPAPSAPVRITSPKKGRAGGRQKDLVKCRGCPKKMTRAALPRHRTKSCPSNGRKRQYPCLLEDCDKSYTRSDALTRHLKRGKCSSRFLRRASTCSTSSSSSGYSGDLHAHFPVSPQSPHTPNSSGSLSSPNPPALEAAPIPPISTNPIADHGHTQLQFEPANPNLHANPNFYASHDPAFPVAVENYRYGLPLPQFLDQHPPLSFTPNHAPSTCSTSSSSSGYSGDPHAHFPVSPQSPHTPSSSGSLSSPTLSALEAVPVPPISTDPIADHGHTQLQFQPSTNLSLHPNPSPTFYAGPNFCASHNPVFPVAGGCCQCGLPAPRFCDQYPPLSFTPNHAPLVAHQGHDFHPRPIDLVPPAPPEDILPLQCGRPPNPAASMSQSRGDSNHFIPELLPDGDQFLPDISMNHAPPTSNNHWGWGQYDDPACQPPLACDTQPTNQANPFEPKASEEALPSAIFVPENHDLVLEQATSRHPTLHTPPGENYTINNQAMARFDALYALHATSGFSEFPTAPIHEPDFELGPGSALDISANAGFAGTGSWTMLCPPSEYSPPEGPFEL